MKKIKLCEVIEIKRGTSLSGEYYSNYGDKIRLTLGNFCYPENGFKMNTSKTDIYFTGEIRPEFIMKKGDIITPLTEQVRGLLGNTATIPDNDLYIQSGDIGKIIIKKGIDDRFAFYLVSSPIVKKQLDSSSQQTKIRHTSPDKIKDCIVYIPDIEIQKKISQLLDRVNDKISNNNDINKTLEAMIKIIYDYWFLQFDFPNENGEPYKSSGGKMVWNEELKKDIPEKWTVNILSSVVSKEKNAIVDGPFGTQMKIDEYVDEGIPIFEMKQLEGNFIVKKNSHYISEAKYNDVKRSTVKNGDIIMSKTGTLGKLGIVRFDKGKGVIVSRLMKITPDEKVIGKYALLMVLQKLTDSDYWIKVSNGSTMPILNNKLVSDIKVIVPNNNLYLTYESIVASFYEKIFNVQKENEELTLLRDFLFPMLMNGQVSFNS